MPFRFEKLENQTLPVATYSLGDDDRRHKFLKKLSKDCQKGDVVVYIVKKEEIDKTVKDLEERLNEVDSVQLLTNNKLTKQIVSTHIEKVVVDCLGFFTVIYK